jgi:5-methylcytosine-specific restriction endonuclease McrA
MSEADFPYRAQVLAFDPAELLERLKARGKIDPFKRRQNLTVDDVLPVPPTGFCTCGCGEKVVAPRRKWAHDACPWFGYAVQGILLGDTKEIGRWLMRQRVAAGQPICCEHCGATRVAYEVDHKLAVALGGGGRWLDNYQLLCGPCHLKKTATDRKLIAAYRKALTQPTLF